ncbi:MAG TPA: hypothetical protein DCK95_11900 [Anaerolineaceae bacterium]|nr:hypothetical protein [Anaerolineaceae bacterium]
MIKVRLKDVVNINPRRIINKGDITPYISMSNLEENKRKIPNIEEREYKGSGSRFINGDTLFARITPCLENGKTAFVDVLSENEVAHGSTEFIVLRGKEGLTDNLFVYYLSRSDRFRRYAIKSMTGTSGRQRVQIGSIENYEFLLPPLDEQKRIAHILGTLDDKIELNQRMNETLEAIARAIFKSWFVDFDPVRAKMAGKPYPLPDAVMALFPDALVESELGMIPKGWEVGTISDISEVMIGGDWGKEEKYNGYNLKVRCLRGTDLEKLRQYGYSNEVPVRWIKKSSYKKRSLDEFDIIIASSGVGPLGRPLWINPWLKDIFDEPITYSNFTKRIRANTINFAIYLDRILYELRLSEKIWEFSTGTSIPNLDINSLITNHLILLPNDEIINLFAKQMMLVYKKLFDRENQILSKLREENSFKFFNEI